MILIIGASGQLGSTVAQKLLDEKIPIRCSSRKPEKLIKFKNNGAEICQADLRDPESLLKACEGVETVVVTAHSLLGRGKESSKYVDYQGHINLIEAAKMANVKHFIYISILLDDPNIAIPFIQFKYQIENYLKLSGLNYTIIKPSAFIEEHVHKMIGIPIIEKGKVIIFGKGDSLINFVAIENVAECVIQSLNATSMQNKTLKIGGPENLSVNQVVSIYENFLGKKVQVSHIPRLIIKVMSILFKPFHKGLSQVMAFSLYLDIHGCTIKMSDLLEENLSGLLSLEKWIEKQKFQTTL